ncbi:MAG TPA: exonuclease domain-containing protein, partial [Ktedonobacterales bacterium]|nr:exonuclease domain-containing protein [Ktedonobacterales bacterium]
MTTPEDQTVKRFQRLIAPSADAADDAEDSSADALPRQHGELLRNARDVLRQQGRPMPAAMLAQHVFATGAGISGGPWIPLLNQLLRTSPAFACDATGSWRLTIWDASAKRLDEMEFVALDIESTGLAPGRHRILEVGAVIIRNGEPGAHFQRLVNPGRRIPQFITRFTGISEAMVKRAGTAAEILPKLYEFVDNRPIVGHNIGFDLGFLSYEAHQAGLDFEFPVEGIDTIALARRYLTGTRRASLDRVATALHLTIQSRHRALPDALLTAQVFALLLARAREEGCETLDDLRQAISGVAPVRSSLPAGRPTGSIYLNPAWRQNFPTRPGVYLMKDADGEVIYVGKAKSLRDRLSSYYSQPLGYTRKMDGLLQSVQHIETRVLGSVLEALLVESRLIKELQPRYNVQLRNYELYPFIKVDIQHPYPRFYATRDVSADGARYFGPFRSTSIVNATLELIQKVFPLRTCTRSLPPSAKPSDPCLRYHLKRCAGPCRGELSDEAAAAYRAAVAEACAFLGGERADLIDRLKREMFEAAARQDFERAARLRDAL